MRPKANDLLCKLVWKLAAEPRDPTRIHLIVDTHIIRREDAVLSRSVRSAGRTVRTTSIQHVWLDLDANVTRNHSSRSMEERMAHVFVFLRAHNRRAKLKSKSREKSAVERVTAPARATVRALALSMVILAPTIMVDCGCNTPCVAVGPITQTAPAGAIVASTAGHAGTVADPYDGAAIQTAINAAQSGDTVYIPAGHWLLPGAYTRWLDKSHHTGDDNHRGVIVQQKSNITIQGAGSGNAFNKYGHPIYTASPQGSYTRIYSPGTAWRQFHIYTGASNVTVKDIFFDGYSQAPDSSAWQGIFVIEGAGTGILVKNIRVTQNRGSEGQCQSFETAGVTWDSVLFINTYADMNGLFQTNSSDHTTVKNCHFHNNTWNPIADSYDLMEGSSTFCGSSNAICGVGFASTSTGNTLRNSYFDGTGSEWHVNGQGMPIGVGVNDPGTSGTVSNTTVTGNWVRGKMNNAAIASCEWLMYYNPNQGTASGMTVNGLTVTRNTLIANGAATIDFRGTPSGAEPNDGCAAYVECHHVSNATAQYNYLASPNSAILHDSFTDSYTASNNAGIDVPLASATGVPSVSFSLGTPVGNVIPVTMSGQAPYGAVMYLINESGTTPTTNDPDWVYVPPVSWTRSSTSVMTVYAWTKSAAGAISSRASARVP